MTRHRKQNMKKYIVRLTENEREDLQTLMRKGKAAARKLLHARILLKADSSSGQPAWSDEAISEALEVSSSTIGRVREQFVEKGVTAALERQPAKRVYERKLDGEGEARLVALVCSQPPQGSPRWTLQLLTDKMVELGYVEEISDETIRRTLKKTNLSLG
jgi:transposase